MRLQNLGYLNALGVEKLWDFGLSFQTTTDLEKVSLWSQLHLTTPAQITLWMFS